MKSLSVVSVDHRDRYRAVLLMVAACLLFSLMNACVKGLASRYSPLEIAALRGVSSFPFVLIWALVSVGPRVLFTVNWPWQVARGLLAVVMLVAATAAITRMPLSSAAAINFVAPLLIAVLSIPFFGERVDRRRWAMIVLGFVGILVILRPGASGVALSGGLLMLVVAVSFAFSALIVRVLSRTDATAATVFWSMTIVMVGGGLLAAPSWTPVDRGDVGLVALMGLLGAAGQYCLTDAFRRGEASLVAPYEYTVLIWTLLLDAIFWHVVPGPWVLAGAAIVIAAGVLLYRQERSSAVEAPT